MNSKKRLIGIAVVAALVIITLIANIVLGINAESIAFSAGTAGREVDSTEYTPDQCYDEGYNVCVDIAGEGAVLLKNENNALPLAEGAKVSVLGAMSYNYVLGGTGSAGGKDDENTVMMNLAFEEAGLDVNDEMWDALEDACGGSRNVSSKYDNIVVDRESDWTGYKTINEFSRNTYDTVFKPLIGDYDETAIVTFSRSGSEGASPSMDIENAGTTLNRHYFELSDNEIDLLEFCNENFDKTIVLINSAAPMELGFLDDDSYNVDACLWIGHPGEAGITGVGTLLSGRVNPSGALVDTFAYDMSTNPTYYNLAVDSDNSPTYTNVTGAAAKYYQYEEGIYVGYRYYETADAIGYFDSDAFKAVEFKEGQVTTGYDGVVQFPFGYGESYTTFSQEITSSSISLEPHSTNSVTVNVTNTGNVAGKEVVQLYMEAPFQTDTDNFGIKGRGLEKAKVVLIGFAKTDIIQPHTSATVTIEFDTDELAAFDNYNQRCYVLEAGDYYFNIQDNAHCWSQTAADDNAVYDSVSFSLGRSIIYKSQPESGAVANAVYADKRASDEVTAENAMDDVTAGDGNMVDGYLSRSSLSLFSEQMDQIMSHDSTSATQETVSDALAEILTSGNQFQTEYTFDFYINGEKTTKTQTVYAYGNTMAPYATTTEDGSSVNDEKYAVEWGKTYYVEEDEEGNVVKDSDGNPVLYTDYNEIESGLYHKLSCTDMAGVEDDDIWTKFVSQVSFDTAVEIQGYSGWLVQAIPEVGKVQKLTVDGPGEPGNGGYAGGTWFPCAVLIAATWNTELAYEEGLAYGHQCVMFQIGGAYAPAMNTHRSPFGGRNFEYYSEDGFIAGEIGGSAVSGIQYTGTNVYIKHYALNDNDTNRGGNCTWANEQAIREIYCRPFEISCKKYNADGIMASLNRIGMAWAHTGFYVQMTRNEWGFEGMLITDGDGRDGDCYNNANFWLMAEGAMLARGMYLDNAQTVAAYGDGYESTNYGQYKLAQVIKHVLWQYVSANPVDAVPSYGWIVWWIVGDVVLVAAIALVVVFVVIRGDKKKKD